MNDRRGPRWLCALVLGAGLGGCGLISKGPPATVAAPAAPADAVAASPSVAAQASPAAPPAAINPMPFDEAAQRAADDLFSAVEQSPAPNRLPRGVVIDPLVDGHSGIRTVGSEQIAKKISARLGARYKNLKELAFSRANLKTNPLVLVGTLTPVNSAYDPNGRSDLYRICLALADPSTGKIVAKSFGRATESTVDATPGAFDADSPAPIRDGPVDAYIRTCQNTKPGDDIVPGYLAQLTVAATLNEAQEAYEAKRYADALRLYVEVSKVRNQEQLRALNGLYLANLRLGRRAEAAEAFRKIVKHGLDGKKLTLKMMFRPNAAELAPTALLADQ
jgi:hypothetical protein